ncbi:methyl-accepting chemotaxis protein [Vibrio spartinae]|uniref:Methyl-accepting chemotaxis protein McpS n=1 Tax=Vibrio spartinae TaxID=1918945 RepID=A0A1N6M301_9VIBR|nr:methyl-accepting chemotaxis protein [Vibrio spartinae]SIO93785.1 Methyl-accepting chemotaxis protein McpS [Vibrio spartinae]
MQPITLLVTWMENVSLKRILQMLMLLFVVVITGLVSYTVIALKLQKDDSLVINIAGRERMLSQKIAKEFFLELEHATLTNKAPDLSKINATKELFEVSLAALDKGGQTYSDLAMQQPVNLPPASEKISQQLKKVMALWRQQQQMMANISDANVEPEVLQTINQQSLAILKNMNAAVTLFAQESEQKIFVMERNQVIAAILAILLSIIVISLVARSILRAVNQSVETTTRISSGNLVSDGKQVFGTNELGLLAKNIEQMRESLHHVINVVKRNSRQMAHSAQQVADVSTEISNGGKVQRENSSEVNSAIDSLLGTSQVVSDTIERTSQISQDTLTIAQEGIVYVNESIEELKKAVVSVNNASEQMEVLKNFTSQINEITESIHNIAEQTNLLALNAAIEAARAGEQGRGFAVVADEVRNLAGRTSSSSRDISDLISQLTEKVESSVSSMQSVVSAVYQSQQTSEKTVEAFTSMSDGIGETTASTETILQYNQQQMKNLNYLNDKLKDLFIVLTESSDKAGTTSMVAGDLYHISELLDQQINGFKTHVSASVAKQQGEQRNAPRADNKLRVRLSQGQRSVEGITSDISMDGMKLRTTSPLDEHDTVALQFLLPEQLKRSEQNQLVVQAKIVHTKQLSDNYDYGLKFIGLSKAQHEALKSVFKHFNESYRYQETHQ